MLHNTCKVNLFIDVVKYFAVSSWGREQQAPLGHHRLLDKAKSHKTVMADYHHNKESRQDFVAFPATVSASIVAVYSSDSYRISLYRTCGRCGLTHTIVGHFPAPSTQCGKTSCPNHWQHMDYTSAAWQSLSRRAENGHSRDRH